MTASTEPVHGHLIRVHSDDDGHYSNGSPYLWVCFVDAMIPGWVCELKGLVDPGNPECWRVAEAAARKLGYTCRYYERHINGKTLVVFKEL